MRNQSLAQVRVPGQAAGLRHCQVAAGPGASVSGPSQQAPALAASDSVSERLPLQLWIASGTSDSKVLDPIFLVVWHRRRARPSPAVWAAPKETAIFLF